MATTTSPVLRVRPATPLDVPTILAFVRELADYEKSLDQVVATEANLMQDLFPPANQRVTCEALLGEIDGVAQGFALFFHNYSTWVGRKGIYLEDLFVRPAARGSGLGKALLVRVAAIAAERGCQRMDWSVLDWNTSAIGFYKSLGAVPLDEWTIFRFRHDALTRVASLDALPR